jgi:hypothetical protein
MNILIKNNIEQIKSILLVNKVESAYLFGSMTNAKIKNPNDIDLLIRFNDKINFIEYSDNYFRIINSLQELLKKDVDIVAEETISNKYLKQSIDAEKIQIL